MAIGKWISFGTSQAAATPVPAVVEQAPIVSAADAKLFGLENVRVSLLWLRVVLMMRSLAIPGEYTSTSRSWVAIYLQLLRSSWLSVVLFTMPSCASCLHPLSCVQPTCSYSLSILSRTSVSSAGHSLSSLAPCLRIDRISSRLVRSW